MASSARTATTTAAATRRRIPTPPVLSPPSSVSTARPRNDLTACLLCSTAAAAHFRSSRVAARGRLTPRQIARPCARRRGTRLAPTAGSRVPKPPCGPGDNVAPIAGSDSSFTAGGDMEQRLAQAVERSVEHAVFGGEAGRRQFIQRVGAATAVGGPGSVLPPRPAQAPDPDQPEPPRE